MHVNTRKVAFLGLLLAVSVFFVVLGGVIETSTFFLLAAASFGTGVAIREGGKRMGVAFYLASVALSFLIAPNKFYCATYSALGLYILLSEAVYDLLASSKNIKMRKKLLWLMKYLIFNSMYIPMLIFFPKLIFAGKISSWLLIAALAAGQAVLFIYDSAYRYFQNSVWGKFRGRLRF